MFKNEQIWVPCALTGVHVLLWSVHQQYPLKLTPFSKCKFMPWQTTHLWNSLGHWIVNSCQ